jgi:WD40 repeat protein
VATGRELKRFEDLPGAIWSLAVSPDGRYVLAGTGHRWFNGWVAAEVYGAQVWDLDRACSLGRLATPGPVGCVAFAADGRHVLASGDDQTLRTWNLTIPGLVTSRPAMHHAPAFPAAAEPAS